MLRTCSAACLRRVSATLPPPSAASQCGRRSLGVGQRGTRRQRRRCSSGGGAADEEQPATSPLRSDAARRELAATLRAEAAEADVAAWAAEGDDSRRRAALMAAHGFRGDAWSLHVSARGGRAEFRRRGRGVAAVFAVSDPARHPRQMYEEGDIPRSLGEIRVEPEAGSDVLSVLVWVYPAQRVFEIESFSVLPKGLGDEEGVERHQYFESPVVRVGKKRGAASGGGGALPFLYDQLAERGVDAAFFIKAAGVLKDLEAAQYSVFLEEAADILSP